MSRVMLEPIAYRRDSRLEIIVMSSSNVGGDDEGSRGGDEGGGDEGAGEGQETERVRRAAAACDFDALEAAIKAAIKPPRAVGKN